MNRCRITRLSVAGFLSAMFLDRISPDPVDIPFHGDGEALLTWNVGRWNAYPTGVSMISYRDFFVKSLKQLSQLRGEVYLIVRFPTSPDQHGVLETGS